MELNFKPNPQHFKKAIDGIVTTCCESLIELFEKNDIKRFDIGKSTSAPVYVIFYTDYGELSEECLSMMEYYGKGDLRIYGENGWSGRIHAKGGDGFIVRDCIGNIYEAVAKALEKGDVLD